MTNSYNFYFNNRATKTLTSFAGGGRFPHALLLEGALGTGKRSFAKLAAAAVLCTSTNYDKPCLNCAACQKVLRGTHPDALYYGEQSDNKGSFHIDEVRQICKDIYTLPNEADKKVYILANAHNMTVQAQNALLKSLEEPPAHIVFILTCENRGAMLTTILSRVQIISIQTPTIPQCAAAVSAILAGGELPTEEKLIPTTDANILAACTAAGGSIGKALNLLQNPDELSLLQISADVLRYCFSGGEYSLQKALAPATKKREKLLRVLQLIKESLAMHLTSSQNSNAALTNITPLHVIKIIDIIDVTAALALQNANIQLLTAVFVSRVKSVRG